MKKLMLTTGIIVATITIFGFLSYADDSVINACHQKKTGLLRIVEKPTDCLPKEVAISWNVQGPAQGPVYFKESVYSGNIGSDDIIEQSVKCDGENDYVTGCSYSLNSYQESRRYYRFIKVLPDSCLLGDICQGCRVVLYNSADVTLSVDFSAIAYCSSTAP